MSSGAAAQIALRGPQDKFLLSNEENTFWRTEYPRHTNAAVAELSANFQMSTTYGANKIVAKIPRNGDLISQIYLRSQINRITYGAVPFSIGPNNYAAYVDSLPHAMTDRVVCRIGSTEFDTQQGLYMEMAEALMAPANKLMSEQNFRYATQEMRAIASTFDLDLWTPLRFWFCRFYEQALPYVALYWNDLDIELTTRPLSQLVQYVGACNSGNTTVSATPNLTLVFNAVYLDEPERRQFSAGRHEYIFDQVQYLGAASVNNTMSSVTINIRFNHPTQELLWVCHQGANATANEWFNWDGPLESGSVVAQTRPSDPFVTARINLNNNERTENLPASYFRLIQPQQYHSRVPSTDRRVYCYSFALRPEELLDTGSVNFSRYDSAYLNLVLPAAGGPTAWNGNVHVFARSKNIAVIEKGMMGRLYAA